jgi:hypothetical protein
LTGMAFPFVELLVHHLVYCLLRGSGSRKRRKHRCASDGRCCC